MPQGCFKTSKKCLNNSSPEKCENEKMKTRRINCTQITNLKQWYNNHLFSEVCAGKRCTKVHAIEDLWGESEGDHFWLLAKATAGCWVDQIRLRTKSRGVVHSQIGCTDFKSSRESLNFSDFFLDFSDFSDFLDFFGIFLFFSDFLDFFRIFWIFSDFSDFFRIFLVEYED